MTDAAQPKMQRHYQTAQLWSYARSIAAFIEEDEPSKASDAPGVAVSCVLLSAMSVEAFLNELPTIARHFSTPASVPGTNQAAALTAALDEIESNRGSITLKLLVTAFILRSPIDKSSQLYGDFRLLFRLRDEVAHLKLHSRRVSSEGKISGGPKVLDQLFRKGLVSDPATAEAHSFLQTVGVPNVARWSVEAARQTISFLAELPEHEGFKALLNYMLAFVLNPKAHPAAEGRIVVESSWDEGSI